MKSAAIISAGLCRDSSSERKRPAEITVRDALPGDAERLLEIYAYYVENTAVSFEYVPPSLPEFQARMKSTVKKYPYLVIEKDGEIRGYAYAGAFSGRAAYDRSCENTIYIDRAARGCGLGRIIYEALEERLKKTGVLNMYACIAYPEAADEYLTPDSAEFHRRMGYVKVGEFHKCGYKFGRWYNIIWVEKLIGEHLPAQAIVL